jgi:hypothetical protein
LRKTNSGDDLMSKMLEQAIADAAALREQAIKNAEQSVIEKYSQQIKEAVDQMLEIDEPSNLDKANEAIKEAEEEIIQEEEAVSAAPVADDSQAQAHSPAWDSRYDDVMNSFSALLNDVEVDENGMVELDLGDLQLGPDEAAAAEGDLEDSPVDLDDLLAQDNPEEVESASEPNMSDLEAEPTALEEDIDISLQEVVDLLENDEEEVVEEAIEIDHDPIQDSLQGPGGGAGSRSRKEFNSAMADVVYEDEDEEESEEEINEDAVGQINELHETIEFLTRQNEQMERVLSKVESYLEETLLSNAKLLYQNRTLSDASLNERQKSKIVEAIANAESPKEAKRLHETLKATVGSTPNSNNGPQSLSESVNRRSNLSAMLNSRQNINESKQSSDPFMEKMQKLAGIKK